MYGKLSEILNVPQEQLDAIESETMRLLGRASAMKGLEEENGQLLDKAFRSLGRLPRDSKEVREALFSQIEKHEQELYRYIGISAQRFDFERVATSAREIATESAGWFLKKDYAKEILQKRPPYSTMHYLGYSNAEDMLRKEDVGEVFSALRFTESDDWMHETFDAAYNGFTPDAFEERAIELRVLGPQWKDIAQKYVAKKHHNVSHLKEFGIIFLNPIAQTEPGKFLRDFALLLHYFHEVAFYSKLFRRYAELDNFSQKFISLLRGDVLEKNSVKAGEWLIVQRYLWKVNSEDPRLFLPHVNPESIHWRKAQEDLVAFGKRNEQSGLEFWDQLWAAAGIFPSNEGQRELVSFEMEDNAMGVASRSDGGNEVFYYHQREALWNRIFAAYAGGYPELEKYIIENMEKGSIML